jgi:DNA-binding transcriptional MocR family regulator
MDRHRVVIYCGTFSKVLFPGIRVGWIAAERALIEHLTAVRRFSELSPSFVLHAAVHEFCRRGYYDSHLSRMHRVYRKRMRTALESLRRHVSPRWAEWTEPDGGYLIWLELKSASVPVAYWEDLFASHGVRVALGGQFFPSDDPRPCLRLAISGLDETEIAEGIGRVAAGLARICER